MSVYPPSTASAIRNATPKPPRIPRNRIKTTQVHPLSPTYKATQLSLEGRGRPGAAQSRTQEPTCTGGCATPVPVALPGCLLGGPCSAGCTNKKLIRRSTTTSACLTKSVTIFRLSLLILCLHHIPAQSPHHAHHPNCTPSAASPPAAAIMRRHVDATAARDCQEAAFDRASAACHRAASQERLPRLLSMYPSLLLLSWTDDGIAWYR